MATPSPRPSQVYLRPPTGEADKDISVAVPGIGPVPSQKFVRPQESKTPRRFRSVTVAQPAAGAEWVSPPVPAGVVWKLHGIQGKLVTSAVVAARHPNALLIDALAGVEKAISDSPTTQPASVTQIWDWTDSTVNSTSTGSQIVISWYPTFALEGDTFKSLTVLIDAGDQWSQVVLFIEEYTLPKGLARGEIPLGLESANVMAEPAQVRKVA